MWNRLTERELPIFMIGICWCGRIARSCAFSIEVCPWRLFLWISFQNLFDYNRILLWTKWNLQLNVFILFYPYSLFLNSDRKRNRPFYDHFSNYLAKKWPETVLKRTQVSPFRFRSEFSMQIFYLSRCEFFIPLFGINFRMNYNYLSPILQKNG